MKMRQQQSQDAPRIHVVGQHFPPDETSTARYTAAIVSFAAELAPTVVVSGTRDDDGQAGRALGPGVRLVQFPVAEREKGQLFRRAVDVLLFSLRVMFYALLRVKRNDLVFVVSTPFPVCYAAALAAMLRRRRVALLLYDLFPDALLQAGLVRNGSLAVRLLKALNRLLLPRVEIVVAIGHEMQRRASSYLGPASRTRFVYIPNWIDLDAAKIEAVTPNQVARFRPERRDGSDPIVIALSGNLGFTHDPETVLEAARMLQADSRLHFTISGWGTGWARIKRLQADLQLPNVTLLERIPEENLPAFLLAGDIWVIPYKPGIAGISVPSRLYNLLLAGRPILALTEERADHARLILEHGIGWVVPPGDGQVLATRLKEIADDPQALAVLGERARAVAPLFSAKVARSKYRDLFGSVIEGAGAPRADLQNHHTRLNRHSSRPD